jgi:hypothetical protein
MFYQVISNYREADRCQLHYRGFSLAYGCLCFKRSQPIPPGILSGLGEAKDDHGVRKLWFTLIVLFFRDFY